VLWQPLVERANNQADLLKNVAAKEQQITDLEQELKQVREAAATEKNRLEDELTEEKRKAKEATAQFNSVSIGRSNLCVGNLVPAARSFCGMLIVMSRRLPQP
jgi:C4-type Zn-finger protein